jgi:hypothetical protein
MSNQKTQFTCPCCGYQTLSEAPGSYAICKVCFWEDDPAQQNDPDYRGGANLVSLREGQKNFKEFGACEQGVLRNVRPPQHDEMRTNDWKFLDDEGLKTKKP